jgi:hypothetical protein
MADHMTMDDVRALDAHPSQMMALLGGRIVEAVQWCREATLGGSDA